MCVELSPSRGYCTYTLSDRSFYVDETRKFEGKTWWEVRPYMIQVPPQTWAKLKAFIMKICKERGGCDQVGSWENAIHRVDDLTQR